MVDHPPRLHHDTPRRSPAHRWVWVAGVVSVLLCTHADAATRRPSVRRIETFALNLPDDHVPEAVDLGPAESLRLTATPGEYESAMVAVCSGGRHATFTAEAGALTGPGAIPASNLVVRHVIRRTGCSRYLVSLERARPALRALGGRLHAVLVPDEQRFARAAGRMTRRGDTLDLDLPPGARFVLPPRRVVYLILTVHVPPAAPPGAYRGTLRLRSDDAQAAVSLDLPLHLTVLPFTLPHANQRLFTSNDFGSPRSPLFEAALRDQHQHGMNGLRGRDLVGRRTTDAVFDTLRRYRMRTVIHHQPPQSQADLARIPRDIPFFFYGVDEPQPKPRRGGEGWRRMAQHIELSRRLHRLGAKVVTSIPYDLAIQLRDRRSVLYREHLRPFVSGDVFEPLDWANVGLGYQRLVDGRDAHRNHALWDYLAALQHDADAGRFKPGTRIPAAKHDWIETYYFPLGFLPDPFMARLLFGLFLFESHLDGCLAWTYYRPRGNPFTDADGPDAVVVYPALSGRMVSTYAWEAAREGVDDLRYATLADTLIARLEAASDPRAADLRRRLRQALSPFRAVVRGRRRIDQILSIRALRTARDQLVAIIGAAL